MSVGLGSGLELLEACGVVLVGGEGGGQERRQGPSFLMARTWCSIGSFWATLAGDAGVRQRPGLFQFSAFFPSNPLQHLVVGNNAHADFPFPFLSSFTPCRSRSQIPHCCIHTHPHSHTCRTCTYLAPVSFPLSIHGHPPCRGRQQQGNSRALIKARSSFRPAATYIITRPSSHSAAHRDFFLPLPLLPHTRTLHQPFVRTFHSLSLSNFRLFFTCDIFPDLVARDIDCLESGISNTHWHSPGGWVSNRQERGSSRPARHPHKTFAPRRET
ncbi:hypothetical protein BT67DRAFT_51174 [Trichocladium antarcticum]|uniref:Uncharacterized protein n=1 Tax=Trichocladium antarcticum TaxID=1450529 RepID=A0AAN6UIN3_9PEZI|nr:hypothetical protein BT67DRAFT_51174 [Trichocladium antarcticum]